MLRTRIALRAAVAAAALLASTAAIAQGGLGPRLDAAEQKLAQDSQSCTPINLGDYQSLLNEAAKNKKRAQKAAKAGAPVDPQVDADLAKASALFNQAVAAHVQQCVRQAQQPPPAAETLKQGAMNFNPANQQMLDAHNRLRAAFGAPPLQLNSVLVEHATARAQEMARAGDFTHASREGRGTERENIVRVPSGYSILQIFERWAREESQFKPGIFPNVCTTEGDCSGVLHLTAILWPTTTDIGCGFAQSGGYSYGVCRYNPGGNKDGKPVGLPVQIAENSTIRARPVGGDYGTTPNIPASADSQIALNHEYGYDGGLFVGYDLGAFRIEAEVAYKRAELDDVYDVRLAGGGESSALRYMINGLLDFGDDDGVSGFVGGGVGVARVDYNNIRAFSNQGALIDDSDTRYAWLIVSGLSQYGSDKSTGQAIDWSPIEDLLFRGSWAEGFRAPEIPGVVTAIAQPTLPNTEVFKSGSQASISAADKNVSDTVVRSAPLFDLGIYAGGSWATDWFDMGETPRCQMEPSVALIYDLGSGISTSAQAHYVIPLGGYDEETIFDWASGSTTSGAAIPPDKPVDTKVQAPDLPTQEVYNPADAPKCILDIM